MSTWTIDPDHTKIEFATKHLMVTTVRGRLGRVSGEVDLDLDDLTGARGEILIDVTDIDTGVAPRDAHLRSADFFDVAHHPTARFAITSIAEGGRGDFSIAGDLTIRDVTRRVVLDALYLGVFPSTDGARRVGASARTTINRRDWGLGWNVALESGGWMVGEDVQIDIEIAVEEAVSSIATNDMLAA